MNLCLGILDKVKEGAQNVHTKIQAKAESVLKHGVDASRGTQASVCVEFIRWFVFCFRFV